MELRQLTYTVVLSEELNFRKAASRLHMTQPPLSRQIKQLEDELGIILFNRNKSGVRLTEAGGKFVKEARKIIDLVHSLPNKIDEPSEQVNALYRVGFIGLPSFAFAPELEEYLKPKGIQIKWTDYIDNQQIIDDLIQDKLDLVFHYSISSAPKEISSSLIFSEPLVMIIDQNHPLKNKAMWDADDYAKQNYVLPPYQGNPLMVEHFHYIAHKMGFDPKISQEFNSNHARLHLVAQGLGITFDGISAKKLGVPKLLYKPLYGDLASDAQVYCSWRKVNPPQVLSPILEFFKSFTQKAEIDISRKNNISGMVRPMV